jgi:energy-coupling factor transport system permease protein
MFQVLALGVYYPGTSLLHRLQARTKLLALLWIFLVLAIANHHVGRLATPLAVTALAVAAIYLSGVPVAHLWQRVRFLWFIPGAVFVWVLLFPTGNPVLTLGSIVLTDEGLWEFVAFSVILLVLYILATLLTMTTTPVALVEGLTILLRPLRWLRLPVDDFALMTLLALRFIPTLVDETDHLILAQTARGAELSRGSPGDRLKSLVALFVPLIRAILRRAGELATALEARGSATDGPATPLHESNLSWLDYAVLAVVAVVTGGALAI